MTEQWHMDKKLSLSHILTTVSIIAMGLLAFSSVKTEVAKNTQRLEFIEQQRAEDKKGIEKRLDTMDKKLDRLLESAMKH
jgi:peptidoglycan hydrolase CwlO-like protein